MKKIYTLRNNHIIIYPGTSKERNLTEEFAECGYCKLKPKTECGHYKPEIDFPACDWFTMKDEFEEIFEDEEDTDEEEILICETNTPEVEQKILTAAKENFKHYQIEDNRIFTIFEHGQWWVRFFDLAEETDRTFSVNDAEGYGVIGGFSFEEV